MTEFFISAFNLILYQPLFNILIFLYEALPGSDFGIAVIILTLTIRIALYPLTLKSIKIQKKFSQLQPKIKEIQEKYKKNKEEQAKKMMEFYQKEKINPFGGCLLTLLQLPILIALFWVLKKGLEAGEMNLLYSFIPEPGLIDPFFLGLINLSEASLFLAFLAGVSQFFQMKMLAPKKKKSSVNDGQMAQISEMMQKQMVYLFPLITFFILCRLPAAIGLYWLVTALFSIFQQKIVLSKKKARLKNVRSK
jgi:YidC/Oxa1 family membrane protein insertase